MEYTLETSSETFINKIKNFLHYGNIMIDLETLSTRTNASIISIAAVEFGLNGDTGREMILKIKPSEWGKYDRHIDGNTIAWWMGQDAEAVKSLFAKDGEDFTLLDTLSHLSDFVKECDMPIPITQEQEMTASFMSSFRYSDVKDKKIKVWGNGSTMDITILQSAYEYFNMQIPWQYWAVNDVRTIVALNPEIKKNCTFEGVKHNPIDDCKHQIKYLTETIKTFNICKKKN